jgi:hypothetical protein
MSTDRLVLEALREIADANAGDLTADAVVEAARPKDSPLHGFFEWDNRQAADSYRLTQARTLIRKVRIEVGTLTPISFHPDMLRPPIPEAVSVRVPAFVRKPNLPSGEQGYVDVRALARDPEAAREALLAEFAQVGALLRRARGLALALGLADAVTGLIDDVTGLRRRLEEREVPEAPQQ